MHIDRRVMLQEFRDVGGQIMQANAVDGFLLQMGRIPGTRWRDW
jgi:hypothetical protein